MTDLSSVTSSAAALFTNPAATLKKAAADATTSFEGALSKVQNAVGLRPKSGFTSGPTYEAGTLAGQTKAAINHTISAAKAALHIKP